MGKFIYVLIIMFPALFVCRFSTAQVQRPQHMLRIYDDNDFINLRGTGTDQAYTNGTRFDYLYVPVKRPRFFLSRLLPVIPDSSINVYGWSVMQMVITPKDIATTDYQPDDYPYSGALFVTHSLRSYHPVKKFSLQTELLLGVIGPAAMAREGQDLMHHLISYQLPMGWKHQYENAPLINFNLTMEKELLHVNGWFEMIGRGQVMAGTMINRGSLGMMVRIGKMRPYFNGFIEQYTSPRNERERKNKWQLYLIAHPDFHVTFTNALLMGGIGSRSGQKDDGPSIRDRHPLEKLGFTMSYGFALSKGRVGLSLLQRHTTPMLQGLYNHETGNISVYFTW